MKNIFFCFLLLNSLHTFIFANESFSYEQINKKNYSTKTLNILTHEIPVMGEPTKVHAKEFEELTGVKINITYAPFSKLYQEGIRGLKNSKYDIVFYGSLWIADFHDYLEPVPKRILQSKVFKDIIPHYQSIAKWGDTTYQINVDGDRHYFQYRKDLLDNEQYKKEFKNKFNKELKVPETWKELNELGSFFNKKIVENGKEIYPIVEITKKDDLMFSNFIKRAASYAKHPDIKDGFYFDLKTMEPLINTPGFVEALEDFIKAQEFGTSDSENIGIAKQINLFGKGEAIFTDSWDDSFVQAMEKSSTISNKVSSSISLGSKKVWNRKTQKWDYFENVNRVPYFAFGWTSGVSRTSKNKELAFDFLGFFANNKNHFKDLTIGRYGVNPYRISDFNSDFWINNAKWNKEAAKSYVKTLKEMINKDNWLIDLRIYQNRQYMNSLAIGVHRALTKRSTAKEALDEVAKRWKEITKRVGIEKQRDAYKYVVELENKKFNIKEY